MKASQDRKNNYANKYKIQREFQIGEKVLLKVKGRKISSRLGNYKNLAARFCGPFEVLNIIRPVAYALSLRPMIDIHNVFHVLLLNKYVYDPNHILNWYVI